MFQELEDYASKRNVLETCRSRPSSVFQSCTRVDVCVCPLLLHVDAKSDIFAVGYVHHYTNFL
jgi:hypothetical protein